MFEKLIGVDVITLAWWSVMVIGTFLKVEDDLESSTRRNVEWLPSRYNDIKLWTIIWG